MNPVMIHSFSNLRLPPGDSQDTAQTQTRLAEGPQSDNENPREEKEEDKQKFLPEIKKA